MDKSKEIRDGIKEYLKSNNNVVSAEIDANYFCGMDVAITENGETEVYRITVIKYIQEKKKI